MKYLICESQEASGCDYTIGCGMNYHFEDFDGSLQDAVRHFAKKIAYPDGEEEGLAIDGENALAEVWIVPADGAMKLDLESIRKAHKMRRAEVEKREKEMREKLEFERLKRKFGG